MNRIESSSAAVALIGLLALASAMGIGRFSLTPILPLMQRDDGLSLTAGGWLATSNYLGYLAGAVICIASVLPPAPAVRWGLVGVGLTTLAMGLGHSQPLWLILRFAAGAASAFVLVGTSAWAMPILARQRRERWSGHVFSGVGIGIAFAGLVGLAAGIDGWNSALVWIALGFVALLLAALLWRPLVAGASAARRSQDEGRGLSRPVLVAACCYAAFGYGYIIPATFLPAMARSYIDDPRLFGLIWPVFGMAAALSTLASVWLGQGLPPRRLWIRAMWVLAAGVLAPALRLDVATLLLSAICVGGTFMIITMAGLREALRLGGASASRAIGVMTAAFGAGQIAGPVTVSLLARVNHAFMVASLIAVAGLVAGNCVLLASDRPKVS